MYYFHVQSTLHFPLSYPAHQTTFFSHFPPCPGFREVYLLSLTSLSRVDFSKLLRSPLPINLWIPSEYPLSHVYLLLSSIPFHRDFFFSPHFPLTSDLRDVGFNHNGQVAAALQVGGFILSLAVLFPCRIP